MPSKVLFDCDGKVAIDCIDALLCKMSHFSLVAFKIFSLFEFKQIDYNVLLYNYFYICPIEICWLIFLSNLECFYSLFIHWFFCQMVHTVEPLFIVFFFHLSFSMLHFQNFHFFIHNYYILVEFLFVDFLLLYCHTFIFYHGFHYFFKHI